MGRLDTNFTNSRELIERFEFVEIREISGSTPKSCRASLFAHVSDQEANRITGLFRGIRKVSDVIARFGPPDEEREFASGVITSERDGKPARGEVFRGLVYKNLSPVADIYFNVGDSDTVRGTWIQKYIGEKHAG